MLRENDVKDHYMRRDKITAKDTALELGIPVVPGSEGSLDSHEDIDGLAERIGYPVLIKAAAGGGGKGMKVAQNAAGLDEALRLAKSEAVQELKKVQARLALPNILRLP